MKKSIVIIILILIVGVGIYYHEAIMDFVRGDGESIFLRIKRYVGVLEQEHEERIAMNSDRDSGGGFNLDDLGIKKILNVRTEDQRLIDALARQDEAEVASFLDGPEKAADEGNEMVRILRKYSPRPRNIRDVVGLTCLPGVAPCSVNRYAVPTDTKQAEICLTSKMTLMDMELKKYPGCANEIRKYYAVSYLCSLKEEEEICALLASKKGVDSKEQEEALKKHLMRNGVPKTKCVMNLADDLNEKTKCIASTPGSTEEEFQKELSAYCREAVGCHAFSDSTKCMNKYNKLFANDNKKGFDCHNIHRTSLTHEFSLLNQAIHDKDAGNETCDVVKQYEQMLHIENIFDESKTIDDYTQKSMAIMTDPNRGVSYMKIFTFLQYVINKYSEEVQNLTFEYNYYQSCRIGHLEQGKNQGMWIEH
ncbi:MAG: hypothetical protein IJM59_02900 [Proteobacteria bacterium]|nr:hypothetical protein [Pseudomonadota bacterium]